MLRVTSNFEDPRYNLVKDSKKVQPIEPVSKVKNKKDKEKYYQKTLRYNDNKFEEIFKDKKDNQ